MDHVYGYTIVNDVTARDVQLRHKQWDLGKNFDTFCPMGPWIVTADELDARDTRVRGWVNGELRQDARTPDMIFGIETLIETCSRGITLYPATSSRPARRRASAWVSSRRSGSLPAMSCGSRSTASARSRTLRAALSGNAATMAFQLIDKIAVEDEGDGDAVVCVHGLGGTSNTWTPLMGALSRHRVVRDGPAGQRPLPRGAAGPLSIARWVDAMRPSARARHRARALARPFDGHDRLPAPRGRAAEAGAQPRAVRPLMAPAEPAARRSAPAA
jgi:hypothetical protein